MKRSRFKEEQIIAILKEVEAGEMPANAVCRKHGLSEQTSYSWKSKCGGMEVSDAKRLKVIEEENRRLKTLVADLTLDNATLKGLLTKKSEAHAATSGEPLADSRKGLQPVARYVSRRAPGTMLRARLRELAGQRKRYGYLRLHVLLPREDLVVNAKRTCRLYEEEGLTVRTKKRRRLPGRERVPLAAPERRNQR